MYQSNETFTQTSYLERKETGIIKNAENKDRYIYIKGQSLPALDLFSTKVNLNKLTNIFNNNIISWTYHVLSRHNIYSRVTFTLTRVQSI